MQIPQDVSTVGWYRWSPLPGASAGSTVIAGHVDSAVQGLGALFRLQDVGRDDRIDVVTADRVRHVYRVVAKLWIIKRAFDPGVIFAATGAPRLTVVTCGGPFDRSIGSYEDNLVVQATPVPA